MNHCLIRWMLFAVLSLMVGKLSAQTSVSVFGGSSINLNAPGAPYTFTVSTGTATQSGNITESGGSFGFTKDGAGSLTLTGTNTYTGGTGINGGTLQVGTTGALGTGAVNVGPLGTLSLTGGTHTIAQLVTNENEVVAGPNPYLVVSGGAVLTSSAAITDSGTSPGTMIITGSGSRVVTPTVNGALHFTLADAGVLQLTNTNGTHSPSVINIGAKAGAAAAAAGYLAVAPGSQVLFAEQVQFNHTATAANPYWFTSDGTATGTGLSQIGDWVQTAGVTVIKNVGADTVGRLFANGGEIRFTGTAPTNLFQITINNALVALAATVPVGGINGFSLTMHDGVFQATQSMTLPASNTGTIVLSGSNNTFRVDSGKTLTLTADRSFYVDSVQSLRGSGTVTKDGGGTLVLERGSSLNVVDVQDFVVRDGTARVFDYIFRDVTIGKMAGDDGHFSVSGTSPGSLERAGIPTSLGFLYVNYWTPQFYPGGAPVPMELDGAGLGGGSLDPGVVQSRSLTLGQQAGATGTLVMNEKTAGGWFVDNGLTVIGGAGAGQVTLANQFLYTKGNDIILGQSAGGIGTINASGANAQINSGVDLTPLDVTNLYAYAGLGYSGNPLAHGPGTIIIGQSGTGHITVTNHARILSGQTFIGAGSDLTLGSGGSIIGGFTAHNGSTVHALDDATFAFTLGTVTEASAFEAGSTFLVDANADLIFAITQGSGFGLGSYTLFDFAGGATLTALNGAHFSATGLGGYGYAFDLTATQLNLTISAIPEPSTYALLAGAATLGFVVLRRRKPAAL